MPAPDRQPPTRTDATSSWAYTKGLVGYYTDLEVDALLADLPAGGDAAVTVHAGPIPQPSVATPNGVEEAYKDVADGLHFYKDAATLIAVVRQEFQTTVVVNGPIRSVAKIVKSSTGQPTLQNPSTLVTCDADGKWMKLTSAELDKPFANPQMVDLFGLPTAAGGERPGVYESNTAPAGDLKDGDLWLSPANLSATARQLSTLSLSDPACVAFRQSVMDEVRKMLSGGKDVPADIEWTPCVKVLGSGLIEARVLNGMIQLRGELVYTMTSVGSFATVQRLPANFPKPPADQVVVAFGMEQGVAYRRVFTKFSSDGSIQIVGDGKITSTTLTGAQAYAF
jgi:hypothetical protein